MTTLCKWGLPLLVCLMMAFTGTAQTVAITSSQEMNSSHVMDQTWLSIASAAGYKATIHPSSFLSNNDLRASTDLIVISSGTGTISTDQQSNILKYVKAGGHIYIQSEYLVTFDGNQLFQYLLENTGSAFQWGELTENNIGPMNIINGFENGLAEDKLDYFWYGTYGCGDAQVVPFLEVNGLNYAFYYRSVNANIGNIMTNVDHDWIRRIKDNRAPREALMANMMNVLINGLSDYSYQHPTLSLPEDINFCTDQSITAQLSNGNASNIQWYINGQLAADGSMMNISNLVNGDSIYAEATLPTGCLETKITSNIIVVSKAFNNHTMNTSFSDLDAICSGALATITLTYDETLTNIRHNWFLNGKDTPIKTDFYSSDNLKDGDILEHGFTYFNGCEDIYLSTEGSIVIEWSDTAISDIEIDGQSTFCNPATAALSLPTINVNDPTITWYVDNTPTDTNAINIAIAATVNAKEVYATIKYNNECKGWVTITTPVITVVVQELVVSLEEKADHDCINGEGFIEVYSNTSNVNYTWSNGQSGNYISDLSEGTYTVTATSNDRCATTESYEITKITFPLVDSINVDQPSCNEGFGKVQLNLSDNNLDYINVRWINDEGQVVSTEKEYNNLPAGDYKVHVDANGNCEEIYDITIDGYFENQEVMVDTMFVERGETISLRPNVNGYEGYSVEWQSHADLSCTDCQNPEIISSVNHVFNYELVSDEGCRIQRAILVLVNIRDPYYAPSAFSPNNDGVNDYYKIHTRADVFPTSSLMIFDRWGSLIHEEKSDSHGWDGKSFGKKIQKGIYVFVQNFEDNTGTQYLAKGSITIFN